MIPGILEAVVTLGGLALPPAFDFIKKKFIKSESDTPERTMGTLATTKPEALPGYVEGLASYLKARTEYFNRDVIGVPSLWVINLRASIRPLTVAIGLTALIGHVFIEGFTIPPDIRLFFEANISSWFGSKLNTGKQ